MGMIVLGDELHTECSQKTTEIALPYFSTTIGQRTSDAFGDSACQGNPEGRSHSASRAVKGYCRTLQTLLFAT